MQYVEAFRRLGYAITNPRQDWSAANEQGCCITLWRGEVRTAKGRSFIDTKLHCEPLAVWSGKSGNIKRIIHLEQAVGRFDRWVDVIIVHGQPGVSYGSADPWLVAQRRSKWRIGEFDPSTGHFTAAVWPVDANAAC
jgi:hypothetical protein